MASKSHIPVQLLAFLFFNTLQFTLSSNCIKTEREALLKLKSDLEDPGNRLSSWIGENCCSWVAVRCNNRTGHIVGLYLRDESDGSMKLNGILTPSLLALQHLKILDLSGNSLEGEFFPEFIGSFKKLTYLNLSRVEFYGIVPQQLGNISSLRYLDLSWNHLLDDTDGNVKWFHALGKLNSLVSLSLQGCGLNTFPRSIPYGYFKSLSFLDLSINNFNATIPDWLFNITSLKYLGLAANSLNGPIPSSVGGLASLNVLDLSGTALTGPLPKELGNLCNLQSLSLSYTNLNLELNQLHEVFSGCVRNSLQDMDFSNTNLTGTLPDWLGEINNLKSLHFFSNSIYGSIPESLGRLSYLQTLDLSVNQLNGTVAESIGQLSSLVTLDLHENSLNSVISEANFDNQVELKHLDLSSNSLVLDINPEWVPPFKLEYLASGSCQIGPWFPRWLRTQRNLSYLDLSSAGISDAMPDWFWSMSSQLKFLDLSNNQISGKLPDLLVLGNGEFLTVDLSSNRFEGSVPQFPSNVGKIDLSNNSLSGVVPLSIGEMPSLRSLSLSTNNLSGSIPSSLCKLVKLAYLGISNNHLSGKIPNCWNQSSLLEGLDFSNNNLSGGIPKSICSPFPLMTLHLSKNGLTGELPSDMQNCTQLITLDLGYNKFTGKIPTWVAENLPNLKILRFRSNKLHGHIPHQLPQLTHLQVLDLADNNLSGAIPPSFGNLSAMTVVGSSLAPILNNYINFDDYITLILKGMELEYKSLLTILKIIDLSDNNLSGNIPEELADLIGLVGLNLSMNHLMGVITDRIGNLRQLQSLDLSRNALSGEIPHSLATLTYLSHLNLSYNSLSGSIPAGNQLQTLADPSIYVGNLDLCGFPLPKCGNDEEAEPQTSFISKDEEDAGNDDLIWFCVGMAQGFGVGMCIFVCMLLFKKSQRYAYFQWVDNLSYSLKGSLLTMNSSG